VHAPKAIFTITTTVAALHVQSLTCKYVLFTVLNNY